MSIYYLYIYDRSYHTSSKILLICLELSHPRKTIKFLKGKPYPYSNTLNEYQVRQGYQTHNKPWGKLLLFAAIDKISLILRKCELS